MARQLRRPLHLTGGGTRRRKLVEKPVRAHLKPARARWPKYHRRYHCYPAVPEPPVPGAA